MLTHASSNKKHYVSPHKFRDAIATHWLHANSNLEAQKALQGMLGHKDFSTTARYFKLGLDDVEKVYGHLWEPHRGKKKS